MTIAISHTPGQIGGEILNKRNILRGVEWANGMLKAWDAEVLRSIHTRAAELYVRSLPVIVSFRDSDIIGRLSQVRRDKNIGHLRTHMVKSSLVPSSTLS